MVSLLLAGLIYAAPFTDICSEPLQDPVPLGITELGYVIGSEAPYRFLGRRFEATIQIVSHDSEILVASGLFAPSKRYRVHEQKVYKWLSKNYGEPTLWEDDTFLWTQPNLQVASIVFHPNGQAVFTTTCGMLED